MKKNLRLLCLGLAAATITCGFAQENKTSLLKNADMEQGLKGWAFDGGKIMGKNTKNLSTQTGFYGMGQGVLEAWNGSGDGLADSYIMQRVGGGQLPNGTYVFGAYIGASKQYHRKQVKVMENGKEVTKYEYWSNRDSVQGVEIFANESVKPVATNNPDYNRMITADGSLYTDGHATKFNVAVNLTSDYARPGYLTVGLRYTGTNANYVVWDNATLYYFGDMSEADALDAMAKIDMDAAIAVADTLTKIHIHNDTLAALNDVIAKAAKAEVTAANFEEISNELFWVAGEARRSETDYANLKKNIESASKVLDGEWGEYVEAYVEALDELLKEAQGVYDAKASNRKEIEDLRKMINWTAGDIKADSVYTAQADLIAFIEEVKDAGALYSAMQVAALNELAEELGDTILAYEDELMAYDEEEIEFEDRKINPNNLYPYIARVYAAIEDVKNNPVSTETTKMPLTIPAGEDGWMEGTVDNSDGLKEYTSPLYQFAGNVETVTFTVKKAKGGNKYFCLSEFSIFDAEGVEIELTEESFYSDYDHNTLNPGGEDGQSFAGLIDDSKDTYFHSAWGNIPAGDHSFKVTLPNGGYSAFSFKIVSRPGQPHQFPAEMVISTPMPKREALEATLARAKALDAYSNAEVGFYAKDFSYLTNAIAEIEAALVNNPSEDECETMDKDLKKHITSFEADEDKGVNLPVAGKEYRIISGYPEFYNKQSVEKAVTVHADTINTLWWGNVDAADKSQVFVFEPIKIEGSDDDYIEIQEGTNDDGTTWSKTVYCYTIKNVGTELYVDTAKNNQVLLAKQTADTVRLEWLGRGQWNITVKGATWHCGDHNSGNVGGNDGAYGGQWGVGSGIVNWGGGLDGASAWFIREYPELPLSVLVSGSEVKSECIHFQAANTVTLTADKACAFNNLAFYDLYGKAIEAEEVVVAGNKATATFANNIVGCAFAFTNSEGVASVEFNAFEFTAAIEILQAAYDAAVAVAPVEGTDVMQYADITAYTEALAKAEAMLEAGAPSEAEVEAMVKELEDVIAALVPNMPEAGKYYFIYNAVEAFEKNKGYRMTLYTQGSTDLAWGAENELEWNRYWQFEKATAAELKAAGMAEDVTAYFIKGLATKKYIGDERVLKSNKAEAIPFVVNALGAGAEVSLDGLGQSGKRLHANNHGGGSGNGSNIVYWSSGAGTASAWIISEAQYDATDIDFTEVEAEKAVVKGTYDLFGRRVVAPTAPGIYIIDGKKKYVK